MARSTRSPYKPSGTQLLVEGGVKGSMQRARAFCPTCPHPAFSPVGAKELIAF
jgi:hypothetical protein